MWDQHESDPEKGNAKPVGECVTEVNGDTNESRMRKFVDSFKRDPNARVVEKPAESGGRDYDHKAAAERTANSGLAHKLKARHMQMIAIGGTIGKLSERV